MAANAAQDRVRALTKGDAPRDVTAVPLNRTSDRRTARASAGRVGARRGPSGALKTNKNKFQGE
jgi:hypothetical protein